MSTYVLMKVLESAPSRYDKGIRILSLGALDKTYDRLASHISSGWKVLDIGCGTGALSLRAALAGAHVKGIDINPEMLEIARKRAAEASIEDNIELAEMGVAELENEEAAGYDAVISGLCFSELSDDEIKFTLKQVRRILKPEGMLLIADEVRPANIVKRIIHLLIRIPLVIITYILTQTTTSAVRDLPEKIENAGFIVESVKPNGLGNFIEVAGKSPGEDEA